MGFLGQELPGSIICDECTCSHTPLYNRRRTYLRLHVFVHPPLGTPASGLMPTKTSLQLPVGCCQKWAAECRPEHKIPALASVRCWVEGLHMQDAAWLCSTLPGWVGDIPPVLSGEVSLELACSPGARAILVPEPPQRWGCSRGSSALSTPPARL